MAMKPKIKVTPSMLDHHPVLRMYSCRLPASNLYFIEGIGTSFRAAYNNWLDQMKKFA